MKTKLWLLWIVGALVATAFMAAEGGAAEVSWQAVTTYKDGSTITDPVTYQVYTGPTVNGDWTAYGSPVSALTATAPDPVAGATLWYNVAAIANGVEGAKGAAASKTTPFLNPAGVTGISVK